VLTSTAEPRAVAEALDKLIAEARRSGKFIVVDGDLKYNKPEVLVKIDRSKAAALGIGMAEIGQSLAGLLGGDYVNRFDIEGRSYKVIPQVPRDFRLSPAAIDRLYVKTAQGGMVPLSSVVTLEPTVAPNALYQFNQLNSGTLSALPLPGSTLGQSLEFLNQKAKEVLPQGFQVDYQGELRQLVQEGNALLFAFVFAVVVIYLVLAAQFESFVHPIVILAAVPMALTGAIIGLWLFNSSINIFSQIGSVMLIGIASKNGILIVEFANQLRDQGREFVEAVIEAATARLRPVLMTTLATAAGALPLMLATGAGAETRQSIGATVFFGATFAVALTLFVVPALYVKIARNTKSPEYLSKLIERLTAAEKDSPAGSPPDGRPPDRAPAAG
jgi:multidrug efflux pump